MFPVRDTSDHKGDLNVRFWILQKLDGLHSPGSLAQLQFDVITREYFPILLGEIFEGRTFDPCSHYNLRRRCGNEIDQRERDNAQNAKTRGQSLEDLPTIVPQHVNISPGSPSAHGGKGR